MIVGVTGASGFIGRQLVDSCLARDYQVRVLSRKPEYSPEGVAVYHGNLTDPKFDPTTFVDGLDVLFHCAGEIRDESLMRALHVGGTRRLLGAAEGNIGRWVQLSSVGVYGPKRSGIVDESTSVNPRGTYETTKLESDLEVVKAASRSGMQYSILRPSNVFGVDMPNQSLVGMLNMLRKGLFFYIGSSGAVMNYIHVSSVIRALILCGEHSEAPGNAYILSDHVTIEEMVSAFAQGIPKARIPESMARAFAAVFQNIPGMPLTTNRIDAMTGRAVYSSSKIEHEMGYKEEIPLVNHFKELSEKLNG